MDGRCKDCKHWERVNADTAYPYDNSYAVAHGFGVCHKIVDGCDFHEPPYNDRQSVLESDEAFTTDGSGYRSNIFTGADFGCIHFATKGTSDGKREPS
jgi:hypothetical protein